MKTYLSSLSRLFMLMLCSLVLNACAARSPSATMELQDEWYTAEDLDEDVDLSTLAPDQRKAYERRIAERRVGEAWIPTGSYARNDANSLIMETAKTALGTPYVPGGSSTNGFDCSGFVKWTYDHFGVSLPRTAREQANVGAPVDDHDIQVGDIVAFRHPRRGYHTGIYVGDNKFIHSPRRRTVVRINSLDDPYFRSTYLGARRVNLADDINMEEARRVLTGYQKVKASQPVLLADNSRRSDRTSRVTSTSRKAKTPEKNNVNTQRSKKSSDSVQAHKTAPRTTVTASRASVKKNASAARTKTQTASRTKYQTTTQKKANVSARSTRSDKSKASTASPKKAPQHVAATKISTSSKKNSSTKSTR